LDHIHVSNLVLKTSVWLAVLLENAEVHERVQIEVDLSTDLDAIAFTFEEFEIEDGLVLVWDHFHIDHPE